MDKLNKLHERVVSSTFSEAKISKRQISELKQETDKNLRLFEQGKRSEDSREVIKEYDKIIKALKNLKDKLDTSVLGLRTQSADSDETVSEKVTKLNIRFPTPDWEKESTGMGWYQPPFTDEYNLIVNHAITTAIAYTSEYDDSIGKEIFTIMATGEPKWNDAMGGFEAGRWKEIGRREAQQKRTAENTISKFIKRVSRKYE